MAICGYSGPQFVARDFKEFVRKAGMTQVRTSPDYPQSVRQDRTQAQVDQARVHPAQPAGFPGEDARALVEGYVNEHKQANINHNTFPI